MESIRDAFQKVKKDINFLGSEINNLKKNMGEMKEIVVEVCEIIKEVGQRTQIKEGIFPVLSSTHTSQIPTNPTPSSTHKGFLEPLKHQNLRISTGNQGVPTDKQTNRQTDKQRRNEESLFENTFEDALEIINSLDDVKKDIRLKFKRLTNQELLVFSTLYQLDEESGHTNYKSISNKLNLSESSIRDYIGRLIKKGIPIEKNKINNKYIQLSISTNLKKITTLPTILKLRDL